MAVWKHKLRRWLAGGLCLALLGGAVPFSGAADTSTRLELEDLSPTGTGEKRTGDGFSGRFWFINCVDGNGVGKQVTFTLPAQKPGSYELSLTSKDNADRGIYAVLLDGSRIGQIDFYSAASGGEFRTHELGTVTLTDAATTLTLECIGKNDKATNKYGLAADYLTLTSAVEEEGMIVTTTDKAFSTLNGQWQSTDAGQITTEKNASAMWTTYPPVSETIEKPNYGVYAYIPAGNAGKATYTLQSLDGRWVVELDQSTVSDGWFRLATVAVTEDTALSVTVTNADGKRITADKIKIVPTTKAADATTPVPVDPSGKDVIVRVNQIGYDTDKSKRATVVNVADGTLFAIKDAVTNAVLYSGAVSNGVADFTAYQPDITATCYLECSGVRSYTFQIGKYLMQQVSVDNALDFMEQSRADTFEMGQKGIGWRDSHQFSFEMSSLVLQYMANPELYNQMPYDVYKASECEYAELRVQDEPNIVWLMEFAALRYYDLAQNDGKKLHMLIKEQLAWFLYAYPFISEYVPEDMYVKVRDLTVRIWGESACNLSYHQIDGTNYKNLYDATNNKENNNLFSVQKVIGGIKGQLPPAHSIAPNLMMYEVARRDGLANADKYFEAAYNNCAWVIENIDIAAPQYAKGQRMSEHVVMENLAYFLEEYPDRAPAGLRDTIRAWAEKMIARADNLWDMRMASSTAAGDELDCWTGAAYADQSGQWPGCAINEPGSAAGLQAALEAAARVLDDPELSARLQAMGVAAIDDMFGRNPNGRSYFYNTDYLKEFDGADLGWFQKYNGGNGVLSGVVGRLDGSPKEAAYAGANHCNPNAAAGYTEGWVAYNTAWNSSLAYSAAADMQLTVDKTQAAIGETVTVTLRAPMNMDAAKAETVSVRVTDRTTGEQRTLLLTEDGTDAYTFSGTLAVTRGGTALDIAYGYGLFEQTVTVETAATQLRGDVDQDGTVTVRDALMALQAAAETITLSSAQAALADVDGTAGVTANDALMILQCATGKIELA